MFASSMNPTAGSFTIDSRLQRHFYVFALGWVVTIPNSKQCQLTASKRLAYLFFNVLKLFFSFPSQEALFAIYSSILSQHVKNPANKFNNTIIKSVDLLVQLAINFHNKILTVFLPTAIKFHYIFNLRDMSNVFQVKFQRYVLAKNEILKQNNFLLTLMLLLLSV